MFPSLISNEAWPEGIQETAGSPGAYIPEGCTTRLIDVKLCRDDSPPRQPANPLHGALGVRHRNWLLHVVRREGGSHLSIFQSERIHKLPLGKNNHVILTLMPRYWLPGFRNKYLGFKDHFVAGGRRPRQVFSVDVWFPPYDSINCAGEMCT